VGRADYLIKKFLTSQTTRLRTLRYLLLLSMALCGVIELLNSLRSFSPELIYRKDFIQEYLLAKALLNDIEPYTLLPVLRDSLMGPFPLAIFPHPTPHPPPVAILSLPLAFLTYQQAAEVWFVFELLCLAVAVYGILRYMNNSLTSVVMLAMTLSVLAWNPIIVELILGQLMIPVLVLLVGAWQMLRKGEERWGGLLLGFAIAIKLIAWPILVYLAFSKRWQAVSAVCLTAVATNVLAILIMGFPAVVGYYMKTGPLVASLYRAHIANFSLWSLGWKVFSGTEAKVLVGATAPPLLNSPELAGYVACILPLALLILGLLWALRASDFDASYGMLVCVSLLIAPITWFHYTVLTLIPLAVLFKMFIENKISDKTILVGIILFIILLLPEYTFDYAIDLLSNNNTLSMLNHKTSFWVAMIWMIPSISILGLFLLIRHIDKIYCLNSKRQVNSSPEDLVL
jgi:hypothetical protein